MTTESECIFCETAKKKNESLLYETKNFYVVLPLGLIAPGHLLLISKEHYKAFGEMPDKLDREFLGLWRKVHNLCKKQFGKMFECEFGNWGQSINHAHIHFVPYKSKDYEFKNVIKEMVDDKIKGDIVEWKDVKKIYKKEGCYVLFKEDWKNEKITLFHTKGFGVNDESVRTLHVRRFLRDKRGVKGIKWQTMSEEDKKRDDEKARVTKEKLRF